MSACAATATSLFVMRACSQKDFCCGCCTQTGSWYGKMNCLLRQAEESSALDCPPLCLLLSTFCRRRGKASSLWQKLRFSAFFERPQILRYKGAKPGRTATRKWSHHPGNIRCVKAAFLPVSFASAGTNGNHTPAGKWHNCFFHLVLQTHSPLSLPAFRLLLFLNLQSLPAACRENCEK